MPKQRELSINEIVEAINHLKNTIFKDNKVIVGPTHTVWEDIRVRLKGKISTKNLYTIVKCNRNNILKKLGIHSVEISSELNSYSDSDSSFNLKNSNNVEQLKFKITLSAEEWNKLKCHDVNYKRENKLQSPYLTRAYSILTPEIWSNIVHSHFWEQTKIGCSITYKRAKIYPSGINYCTFFGKCTSCESTLHGVLGTKPIVNGRAIFNCIYEGNFNKCINVNKRKMTFERKEYFTQKLIGEKMSAAIVRRVEADNIMEFDDPEPSHLPTCNALRVAKCRSLKDKREDTNPILGIYKMKYMQPYLNIIKDLGYDRFFVHYWSGTEMNIYRKYIKNSDCPTISIDATGSLVKSPLSDRKCKHILLYEIAILDKQIKSQYSVCHILSERHDNNSIYYWIVEWLRDGAPYPKQIVTDMSLALMAAVVRAFTQFNDLWSYLQGSFNFLNGIQQDQPRCFIRCDVAHVIKLVTTWIPLRSVDVRVKEFIIRSIAQMLLCDDFDDLKVLLQHFFWLIYSKTDGNTSIGRVTHAERRRQFLRNRIATGNIEQYSIKSEDIIDEPHYESEMNNEKLMNMITNTEQTGKTVKSPFYIVAQNIALECEHCVSNEIGDHDNLYYIPNISSFVLNLCTYIPLWSGIMCKIFKYGDNHPSSTAIESQFNDLKNRVPTKTCRLYANES